MQWSCKSAKLRTWRRSFFDRLQQVNVTVCNLCNLSFTLLAALHYTQFSFRASKSCTIFDARERAPMAVSEKQYGNSSDTLIGLNKSIFRSDFSFVQFFFIRSGWKSIAVPGEVHGFWTAYKQFGGTIPWKELWLPTIKMCREGIPVSAPLAATLKESAVHIENNTHFKCVH